MVKVYSVLAGDTKDTHKAFIKRIAMTGTVCIDECSAILVFCPVASRAGIDIDEALQKIPADPRDMQFFLFFLFVLFVLVLISRKKKNNE